MERAASPPVLEACGVSVSAGGTRRLEGVSFALGAGAALALRGPSGCGKTTLLRALAGLDPCAGDVLFRGDPAGAAGWPAYRRRVVFVHQTAVMLPGDVAENLAVATRYASAAGDAAQPLGATDALLRRVGLGTVRTTQDAASLSVGQKQRLALVRALLVRPAVLLLDEPTSALDDDAAADVEAVLGNARAEGLAIVLVTHDMAQAQRLADDVLELGPFAASASRAAAESRHAG